MHLPEPVYRGEFYDCQDDIGVIASYADIGVGPAVIFDGAGFTSAVALRGFIGMLTTQAAWLEQAAGLHAAIEQRKGAPDA